MTIQQLPDWAKPGAAVIVYGTPGAGSTTEATAATIVRVEGATAYVGSPAWAQGYERTFIPRRNQWQSASAAQLEEKGGNNTGFNSARLCCPADSDTGRALLRKATFKKTVVTAAAAADAFSRRPSRQSAEALQNILNDYLEVAP